VTYLHKYKILVADYASEIQQAVEAALPKDQYLFSWASNGQEAVKQILEFEPDLIFINIELNYIHGIELIKLLRNSNSAQQRNLPIVVVTSRALIQDYKSAIETGANYYLVKPFFPEIIQKIVADAQSNTLKQDPFKIPQYPQVDPSNIFQSPTEINVPYIKFWGTRGSIPVSGQLYHRHGGNTSCLEITSKDQTIILDAGTGIQALGKQLIKDKTRSRHIHLVIGHTHWDHIIGFPFFAPAYDKDFTIDIYASTGFKKSIRDLFSGMLDYDYFPVRLNEMQAQLRFHELSGHPIQVGDIEVSYTYANHPGAALSFKITREEKRIGYCTDNELFVGYCGHPNDIGDNHPLISAYKGILDFYKDSDILIHEAQYTAEEYRSKIGWGHSSINNAAIMMRYCKPKQWIFTHHDPVHHDELLATKLRLHQRILEECNIPCHVSKSFDSLKILI
jgi:CheY-like chemotaxis protein/phosphoribosyl 1,2-cyclic phosphodiesterase